MTKVHQNKRVKEIIEDLSEDEKIVLDQHIALQREFFSGQRSSIQSYESAYNFVKRCRKVKKD
jgi:uncharacterized protein involved in type VI secretion and phage assembly